VLELQADDPARFGPAAEALDGALTVATAPPPAAPLILDQVGGLD
jgi:hypothetical protein